MQLLQSFLLGLLFSYNALAAPTPSQSRPQRQGRSFKVDRARRGAAVMDGPIALRRSYSKYNIHSLDLDAGDLLDFKPLSLFPTSSQNAEDSEQTGEVNAVSVQGDAQFVSPVTIGGQTLIMNFDTGSADFWVMSTRLPADQTQGHSLFDSSKSSTFKDMPDSTFNITYGDASYAYGGVASDTVDIGGATVTEQVFGMPTEISSYFAHDSYTNGMVGLGFSSLNTIKPESQKTFFSNIVESLDEPVLTALLKSDGVGEYEFGTVDHSKYTGQLLNVTVDPSGGFWEFNSKYFTVGSGPLRENTMASTAIADTGTSLMLLSSEVAAAYYAEVPGSAYATRSGGYIFPCSTELPDFSIAIGDGYLATVPGALINFAGVGQNSTTGEDLCYGGIQSNQGSSLQILGDVFLKALFVVFDMRGPSLAVAAPNS